MYNRILVALDTLEPAVFETALSVAAATEADLLLLHVLSDRDPDSPTSPITVAWDYATPLAEAAWESYQKQWAAYVGKSLDRLREYTGRADAAGVTSDFLQVKNEPGRGICNVAKTWNADLIVMGTHQRTGIKELFMGSVSNYVMHHAPCSVMLVSLASEETENSVEQSTEACQVAQSRSS
ncbi:MAG: universal stress protein [Cyanobacteria bacterium J06560_6]